MRRILPSVFIIWLGMTLAMPGADVDALIKQAKSKDVDQRRNAFKELADAMAEAKAVLPTLLSGLQDEDRYVRRFAAQAIGKIDGLDSKKTMPAMLKIVNDKAEAKEVQEAIVAAMGKLGKTAIDPLTKLLKDKDKELTVRGKAADALAIIGPDARVALPTLLEVLNERAGGKNAETNLKLEAIEALGKIAMSKDADAITALEGIEAMKTKDKAMKAAVTSALKSIKGRK